MKRWLVLVLLVAVNIICQSPSTQSPMAAAHAEWVKVMPNWDQYDMVTQEQIIQMYQKSPNKHLWFPDSFPNPHPGRPVYTPKSLTQQRINDILNDI